MGLILNIESSSTNCSISVSKNGKLIDFIEKNDPKYRQSNTIHQNILDLIKKNNLNFNDFAAVAVSKGPGSYTGLRVGISSAKGLCYALDIPLISIPTLDSLSRKIKINDGYIVPLIDARRMEVYTAIFDSKYSCIEPTSAKILDAKSYNKILESNSVYFVGNATQKLNTIINHKNAVFSEQLPSASQMCNLSPQKFEAKIFEDTAYFEPYYLKDFVAFPSKK